MNRRLQFEPQWLLVIGFFLVGIFLGVLGLFTWEFNGNAMFGIKKIHPNASVYKFINPLLAVDTFEKKEFFEDKSLEKKINTIINKAQNQGDLQTGSVYFRDLEAGRWLGINENLIFSPGNLLKVPIMIAFFKEAEVDPAILDQKLIYRATSTAESISDVSESLTDGESYTVEELIRAMIINDNDTAANLLFDLVDKNSLSEVYTDLGVPFNEEKNTDDFINTKQYALFFRVLYNATYLNRDFSEKALIILSETSVNNGLASGLPNELEVAHKYRTRFYQEGAITMTESHDCGIVFFPKHPHILCLMGIGRNSAVIKNMFREIGQSVNAAMAARYLERR